MPRTTLAQVAGLVDPLMQYNFEMLIPLVPGVTAYNPINFKAKIMSTAIPGRTIEPVTVDLHGVTIEYAGRTQYPRTLPFEIIEMRDMQSRQVLSSWHRYCRDDNSLGSYYADYTTNVFINLYDSVNAVPVQSVLLNDAWLESWDDSSVDGSASSPVQISGTLKYLTFEDLGGASIGGVASAIGG